MPAASRKKTHKVTAKKKPVSRVSRARTATGMDRLWDDHPNLKLLLAIFSLVVVGYALAYAMMYAQA